MIDFGNLLPELFVGSCPGNEVDIKQLRLMGVTGVLNLQTDADFEHWKIDFPALQQASYDLDLVIQRVPIIDFDDADLARHLPASVTLLQRMLAVGHTVYLHCTAGKERSPTVALGYLSLCRGMELQQAVTHITQIRDCQPKAQAVADFLSSRRNDAS